MCITHTTDDDPITENPAPDPTPGTETGNNGSVLVAYFSCTGTTEGIAEGIANITGASTFRIEAEEPYTAADLDYNSDCRANREQNNPKARPAIKSMPDGLDRYDVFSLVIRYGGEKHRVQSAHSLIVEISKENR